ncbi:MAG: hypothetical protein HFJ20_02590 [Clostridia bacterium]|nr:hypothetical protein [Clostridia bacterium]
MGRKKKVIVVLITIILLSISGQVFAEDNIENKIVIETTSWTDVIVVAISLVNLLFVIGFYFNDKRNDKKQKKSEYTFFWYKDYVIKEAVNIIENHINKCTYLVDECIEYNKEKPTKDEYTKYIKQLMEKFNYSNNTAKDNISKLLKVINSEMSSEMLNEFRNIQDIFTKSISVIDPNLAELISKIQLEKIALMNKLYQFGLNEII